MTAFFEVVTCARGWWLLTWLENGALWNCADEIIKSMKSQREYRGESGEKEETGTSHGAINARLTASNEDWSNRGEIKKESTGKRAMENRRQRERSDLLTSDSSSSRSAVFLWPEELRQSDFQTAKLFLCHSAFISSFHLPSSFTPSVVNGVTELWSDLYLTAALWFVIHSPRSKKYFLAASGFLTASWTWNPQQLVSSGCFYVAKVWPPRRKLLLKVQ